MHMKWYCLFSLLLITGCTVRQPVKRNFIIEQQEEVLAKFSDIPDAPFQAKLQSVAVDHEQHNQVQLFYKTDMNCHELIEFYQQQMERLGWNFFGQSSVKDVVLYFSKPVQFCSVVIKPGTFTLYFCHKQGA